MHNSAYLKLLVLLLNGIHHASDTVLNQERPYFNAKSVHAQPVIKDNGSLPVFSLALCLANSGHIENHIGAKNDIGSTLIRNATYHPANPTLSLNRICSRRSADQVRMFDMPKKAILAVTQYDSLGKPTYDAHFHSQFKRPIFEFHSNCVPNEPFAR